MRNTPHFKQLIGVMLGFLSICFGISPQFHLPLVYLKVTSFLSPRKTTRKTFSTVYFRESIQVNMRLIVTLLLTSLSLLSFAQPKHFRVMWNQDPSTSLVIGFSQGLVSLQNGTSFQLYYADQDYGDDVAAYAAANQPAQVAREEIAYMGENHYFFRLEGLRPATAYHFIIEYTTASGQVNYTEKYWTKTVSNNPNQPISIVAGGDSRLNIDEGPIATIESITIRREANKMVSKLRPDLVAFGGDYTFANTLVEWIQWFDDWELTYTEDNKITPIVAAIGNHEHAPFGCPACGNDVIYKLFDTPSPDVYYAMSFGGNLLRMYTLNTEMAIAGEQTDWLVQDLAANDLKTYWKMAQYHKPIRPHEAGKSDQNEAFENWALPFYEKQVRLVIECDAHVVKTTHPVIPTTASDGEVPCQEAVEHNFYRTYNGRGTTYAGEGTWAALREGDDPKSWTKEIGSINQVKWIWVFPDRMELRTVRTFDRENEEYVNNVTPLTEANRFTVPAGVELWGNQPVEHIYNNGLTPLPEPCLISGIDRFEDKTPTATILPNPTQNKTFVVELRNLEAQTFSIFNLSGTEVFRTENVKDKNTVELKSQASGVYLLKVTSKNGTSFVQRFVLD